MIKYISYLVFFFLSLCSVAQTLPEKISETDFSIGKTITITSKILNENRSINIYLPPSYTKNIKKRYPVIYLLDGSKNEDFIHISGIVQFGSFPWINLLPESIVVGIANTDRKRDFTYPSQNKLDQKDFPTAGKSENFIQFISEELQPFIADSFRTNEQRTLIGQSLGGLLATEILFKKSKLFDQYIIVSPSLWWDDEKLLHYKVPSATIANKQIYIAVGKEGKVMERLAKSLFEKLKKKQTQNTKLHFDFLQHKTHGDALHLAVYHAFETFKKNVKK